MHGLMKEIIQKMDKTGVNVFRLNDGQAFDKFIQWIQTPSDDVTRKESARFDQMQVFENQCLARDVSVDELAYKLGKVFQWRVARGLERPLWENYM